MKCPTVALFAASALLLCSTATADLIFGNSTNVVSNVRLPLCTPIATVANQTAEPYHVEIIRPGEDFCGVETEAPGLVQGVDGLWFNRTKYAGKTTIHEFTFFMCCASCILNNRMVHTYDLAISNGCSSAIELMNSGNEVKRVPGGVARMYHDVPKEIPFTICQFTDVLDVGYIYEMLPLEAKGDPSYFISAMVVQDTNPWLVVFDSPLYFIFFRGFGLFYLCLAVFTADGINTRLKKPTKNFVPETLLIIELIRSIFMGFHFLIGGMWADDNYPASIALAMTTQLTGMSIGSTLLSGVFFSTIVSSTGKSIPFWERNGRKLMFAAIFCVFLDLFNGLAVAWSVPNVEMILGATFTALQGVISINFMLSSTKFIRGSLDVVTKAASKSGGAAAATNSKADQKKNDKNTQIIKGMIRMARLLFAGAIGMLLYCMIIPIAIISGSVVYGFWSPTGFCFYWCSITITVAIPSVAQVNLSRVQKRGGKKKRSVAPSSVAGTDVASSVVESSQANASTTGGSKARKGSSSVGSSVGSSAGGSSAMQSSVGSSVPGSSVGSSVASSVAHT